MKLLFTFFLSLFFLNMAMAESVTLGDFENQEMNGWSAWAPATASVVANPVSGEGNASAYVLKFDQTAQGWKGTAKWMDPPLINNTFIKISADVYIVDKTGLIQLYMDNSVSGAPSSTNKQVSGIGSNKWTHIEFDISDLAVKDFKQIAFQSDVQGVIYIDNIKMETAPAGNNDPMVLLDPANYDASKLGANVQIVEISGAKYFKVSLSKWDNYIPVDSFAFPAGATEIKCNVKYEVGTSGFELSKINTFLKLRSPNTTEIAAKGAKSSAEFAEYKVPIKDASLIVADMQVAGQETSGWSAVSGDFMYIGKVSVIVPEEPVDPNTVIDPATFDAKSLGTGWEIVDLAGVKYFKVALSGWSSWTNIPGYTFPEGKNAFKTSVKYEVGTGGQPIDDIKTFLKFSNASWEELGASGKSASADFKDYVVTLAKNTGNVAGVFQVAGQSKTTGNALEGDFLYIGKIMAVTTAPVTFVIDDTKSKSYDGFKIKGSWLTDSGIYDANWSNGAEHASFMDSTTANPDKDNIWELTINLMADDTKTWKWGFNDMTGTWKVTGADPEFAVKDWTPVTNTYTIGGTSVNELGSKLTIYPNPVLNTLNIKGVSVKNAEVYNLSGAKVKVALFNESQLDVSELSSGSYLLRIIDNKGEVSISKFVKK